MNYNPRLRKVEPVSSPMVRKRITFHGPALLALLLYSLAYTLGRWGLRATVSDLASDPADLCSFAVARLYPQMFTADALLGNPGTYQFYWTIHVPVLAALTKLFGHCGLATTTLLFPHLVLQGVGFYFLSYRLYANRVLALALSFISYAFIQLNLGEFWGAFPDVMPRLTFQAILPCLLLAAISVHGKRFSPCLILLFAGLLMYVHPVSTPPWSFALLLGFFFSDVQQKPFMVLFRECSVAVCIFVVTAGPFLINYFYSHQHGASEHYQEINQVLRTRFHNDYFSAKNAVSSFVSDPTVGSILSAGLLGFAAVLRQLRRAASVLMFSGWIVGLLAVSVFLPLLQQVIEQRLGLLPVQLDLIRGIRYLIPLAYLLIFWGIALLLERCALSTRYKRVITGTVLLVCIAANLDRNVVRTISAWRYGHLAPAASDVEARIEYFVRSVQELTEPGSPILVVSGIDPLAIRYSALRPLSFAYKDGGMFAYGDHELLLRWARQYDEFNRLPKESALPCSAQSLAADWGARYIIMSVTREAYSYDLCGLRIITTSAGVDDRQKHTVLLALP